MFIWTNEIIHFVQMNIQHTQLDIDTSFLYLINYIQTKQNFKRILKTSAQGFGMLKGDQRLSKLFRGDAFQFSS